jgi:hypothetical protein
VLLNLTPLDLLIMAGKDGTLQAAHT